MAQASRIRYYHWRGVNQAGKKLSGVILGFQEQEVRAKLTEQRIQVKKIKHRAPSSFSKMRNQLKSTDITAITRQLATMVASGVPIVQAMKLIADSHHKAEARATLTQVTIQVEAGSSLARAMRTSSPLFDNFYCDLIATGEQTGHLAQVFDRVATYREKSEAMRKKVIKAMIYPTMVTLTAIGVTIMMLVLVIPQFSNIFNSFNAELPWLTQMVVYLSDWLIANGLYVCLCIAITLMLISYRYKQSLSTRRFFHRNNLRIPIIGSVLLKATIARFARTLATTFSAGIPLLSGLKAAATTSNNIYIEEAVMEAHTNTAAGMPLHIALRQCDVFPELMLQMTMIGEESGSLDDMLNKMATLYEAEVDDTVDNLGKILEPLIIIVLGSLIAVLLLSMYMPIFKLMSVIG